jgi:hypothetical protein
MYNNTKFDFFRSTDMHQNRVFYFDDRGYEWKSGIWFLFDGHGYQV